MLKTGISIVFSFFVGFHSLFAQQPKQYNASEIELKLRKLNVLASVLYLAAHPDDENTRIISYFSLEKMARTGYLAMTRGDGGQNLIGPEIREYLGIIRTQELLAARREDGSEQFFTRANDFGYSKSADETLEIWNREEVLSDIVWTFRNFKPDIVILRFPSDGGGGHGHHTSSSILAKEAFDLSNNKKSFPEQLNFTETWQPKRLYLNTGRWWNTSVNEKTPGVISVDVGKYNPLLGKSYSEIAAISRTQHKSQGFGSTGSRGEMIEFLEYQKGEKASNDIFDGIDITWGRVKGGEKIGEMIKTLINDFQSGNPSLTVPGLLKVRKAISNTQNEYWKKVKLEEVDDIIAQCMGLYLEAKADEPYKSAKEVADFSLEMINRSDIPVKVKSVKINGIAQEDYNEVLKRNIEFTRLIQSSITAENSVSQPYWLKKKGSLGMYRVDDQHLIGKPENDAAITATFYMDISGEEIAFEKPVIYKWNDPVKGELYRPFLITPPAFVNPSQDVMIFSGEQPKTIAVAVKSARDDVVGVLKPVLPKGWTSAPAQLRLNLSEKGEETILSFDIVPPKSETEGELTFELTLSSGEKLRHGFVEINYDHIPTQVVFPESAVKVVKMNLKKTGDRIGYIQGAGDDIPMSLRSIGYEVEELEDTEITTENLKRFDAVILGVRALNTRERLPYVMETLLSYAHDGGNLIVQYNTNRGVNMRDFSPYSLELSRDRVSEEDAKVTILAPNHPVMNKPNKIEKHDFDNWVQERGLYFPDKWDEKFVPVLQSADRGESQKSGGLLVAEYGKGFYVYTGYSWFRELPAGVPGAYKLFVNIISLKQNQK